SYAGPDDLPAGYWVYIAPNWYIWGAQGPSRKGDRKLPAGVDSRRARSDAPAAAGLKKAAVGGKYRRLMKKIEVESDRAAYTDFADYGYCNCPTYAGHDDLPAGYWVYVYPHWYIWGETTEGP